MTGVEASAPDGPVRVIAPWTLDASGRSGFVRSHKGWTIPEKPLCRSSLWTYYKGLEMSAERRTETVIARTPHDGWFWVIPMANDIYSVGVVARPEALGDLGTQRAASWRRQVAMTPWVADLLGHTEPCAPIRAITDLSYRSRYCADDGVVLLGDAFGFLDPVFSAGVFLGMRTGEAAADSVLQALEAGRTDAATMSGYGEAVCAGVEQMRALVYSFYNPAFSMGELARAHPELVGDITDVLIGDLFKPHNQLMNALRVLGTVPPPVPHGRARERASPSR